MANSLSYTLNLAAGGFLGPLGAAKAGLGGFLGVASKLGNITTGLSSAKGLVEDFLGALRQPITAAADMEALNMSFRSLLKDGGAARALVADLMKFADVTPFEPGPVAEAGKQLLAFGFGAKELIPVLKDIGDLSAAMDKPLGEVADTFGRLKAGQFGEAFERLRAFGISMQDLLGAGLQFDKSGSFQGSAEQAMEAVRAIIRRKFGGGMADLATTFKGLFSTLSGYWDQLKVRFGEPIMQALKPLLVDVTNLVQTMGPAAAGFGQQIAGAISTLRNLFQSGEMLSFGKKLMEGIGTALPGTLTQGIGLVLDLARIGLVGAFRSGIRLLSDKNFWDGLAASVMAIVEQVKAALMATMADLIDMLPRTMRMGADVDSMRWVASRSKMSAKLNSVQAEQSFEQVNWQRVMDPMLQSAGEAGTAIVEAGKGFSQLISGNQALGEHGRCGTRRRIARQRRRRRRCGICGRRSRRGGWLCFGFGFHTAPSLDRAARDVPSLGRVHGGCGAAAN